MKVIRACLEIVSAAVLVLLRKPDPAKAAPDSPILSMSKGRRRNILVGVGLTVVLLLGPGLSPSFAAGAVAPNPQPTGTSSQAPLASGKATSKQAHNGVTANSVPMGASPSGCIGQTDYAHYSYADGGTSSVHGRTLCAAPVTQLGVETYLWNLTWWGWNLLNSDTSTAYVSTNSGDATPHYPCYSTDPHDFYGSSDHYSSEDSGYYTAETASPSQTFSC